jgi:hypothetical protein
VLRGALRAAYPALDALPEGDLRATLLRVVGQNAGLQGCYLASAGGAPFGELSHGRYGISGNDNQPIGF